MKRQRTIDQSVKDELAVLLDKVVDVAKDATNTECKLCVDMVSMYSKHTTS